MSLAATAIGTQYVATTSDTRDRLRFESAVQRTQESIQNRLEAYVAMLRGGTGLFAVLPSVAADDFHAYVERIEIQRRYPGIQGIGFSARLGAGERARLVAAMQILAPGFRIWPEFERPEYHTILFLEPLDRRNRAAIGYDMFTEPVRRAAMERARDTGLPAASGKVTLVQEIDGRKQAGFLIYMPVYRGGVVPDGVSERRDGLRGFVYSPFRADDLLERIFGNEPNPFLDFQVFDGTERRPEDLLHRSDGGEGRIDPARSRYSAGTVIDVAGRPWGILYVTRRGSDLDSPTELIPLTLIGGLGISVIVFVVTRSQARARRTAERIAGELHESEDALRESESRLRRLVEASVIGIVIVDVRGHVVEANDAFLDLVGESRRDVEEGHVNWVPLTTLEYRGRGATFEKEYVRKDGRRVPVLVATVDLGGPRALRAEILVDLTERKRAEAEREQLLTREQTARREAETANRLKDEFLAMISHELRTPLTAMLGWTRLLQGKTLDAAAIERALETIERNAAAQVQLVNDLLDVSGIMAGKLRLERTAVDLSSLVESVVDGMRPAAEAKGLRLELDARGPATRLTADQSRLQQVVGNLLANAVKFTPTGGLVQVRLESGAGQARLEVRDTGQGISPEFLPHVFDAFRQFDSSITRSHRGLGLGLALVRHLVELHGGRVRAESDGPGFGATFVVELPLEGPGHIPDAGPAASHRMGDGPAGGELTRLDGIHALIVDDEPDSLELLAELLERCGARVTAARSARAARAVLETGRPDVLVSDIGMPDEDGYALIRAVRALPEAQGGRVPAVALTAYARLEDRERALRAGFDLHLTKPVDPGHLTAMLAGLARPARAS